MKRIQSIFYVATMIGGMLSVASCNSEEEIATVGKQVPLEIEVSGVRSTRSIIEGSKLPEECQYGIFAMQDAGTTTIDNGINVCVNYVKGVSTFNKNIYLPEGVDVPVYAYYPYNANYSGTSYLKEMPIDVSTQIDYLFGYSADSDHKLMYVNTEQPKANIYFKHALARVTMRIKKAADNEKTYKFPYISLLNVDKSAYVNALEDGAILDPSGTANLIAKPSDFALNSSNNEIVADFLVIPRNTEGKKIMLNMSDNISSFENGLSAAVPVTNWEAGQQYTYMVTIKNGSLDINQAEISEWKNSEQGGIEIGDDEYLKEKITYEVKGVQFSMIHVRAGTFTMGATEEQVNPDDNEKPVHQVTLTRDYYIGETEVTQGLWQVVMEGTPPKDPTLPANGISYLDTEKFIKQLNNLTGKEFRLPTEAEWEYAARGGNKSKSFMYSGSNNIDEVAWYNENSKNELHPVATKQPNELDIYDMSGNVWEWCDDWLSEYNSAAQIDPNIQTGSGFIIRGGGYFHSNNASDCRVSRRRTSGINIGYNYIGLRIVLVP